MAAVGNQFVVSVADAFLKDTSTNQMALKAKTLLSTAITSSVQNTEIRGGAGNKLLFDWCYQRDLQATVEDARWSQEYIAINAGATIVTASDKFYTEEAVTLTGGAGTVSNTPVGDLYVEKADGSYITVTPTGSNFTVAGGAATTVKVTYQYNTSIDKVTISADGYPKTYELVLKSQIMSQGGTKIADLEIVIPQYKPQGNFDITFGAADASTSKLEGKALAYTQADGKDVYAYVNIKPVTVSNSYIAIAATPTPVTLSAGSPTQQLTVYGIQGGVKSNVVITPASAGTTYSSSATGVATVSAAGLITRVAAGTATITVSNGGITDTVPVTCS